MWASTSLAATCTSGFTSTKTKPPTSDTAQSAPGESGLKLAPGAPMLACFRHRKRLRGNR